MVRLRSSAALVLVLSACAACAAPAAADEPWRDPSQPPGQRADELLAAMTPDQKVAMALGDFAVAGRPRRAHPALRRRASGIRADGTTSFPSAQTLAASFDRDLARA